MHGLLHFAVVAILFPSAGDALPVESMTLNQQRVLAEQLARSPDPVGALMAINANEDDCLAQQLEWFACRLSGQPDCGDFPDCNVVETAAPTAFEDCDLQWFEYVLCRMLGFPDCVPPDC